MLREQEGDMHALAYQDMNFHRMAIYAGIALVILIAVARLLMSRL
jgi:hypothetical protein